VYYRSVEYEWPTWALDALRGIEPHEVMQALSALYRWPRWATGPGGLGVLTIWTHTETGRPLIVAIRQISDWDSEILGARDMRGAEVAELEEWEASQ
jgi:hypothetical protein